MTRTRELAAAIAVVVALPARSHPDLRITTVLDGTMWFATGLDPVTEDFVPHPPGSVLVTEPGVVHHMWARDGAILVQETGFGPTASDFVEPSGESAPPAAPSLRPARTATDAR